MYRLTRRLRFNEMTVKLRLHSLLLLFLLFPFLVQADSGIRVIDESAIPYMEFLSKKEFDQRFPGQIKSERANLESGWYVIYSHESLNYYFGPILLESTGRDYLGQLKKTVEAAVEQRPDIQGFQLALSHEPSTGMSESSGNSSNPDDGAEEKVGAGNGESPGEAPQPSGVWGFIRRIFGF